MIDELNDNEILLSEALKVCALILAQREAIEKEMQPERRIEVIIDYDQARL